MSVSRSILVKVHIFDKRGEALKVNAKMQQFLHKLANEEFEPVNINIELNAIKDVIFPKFIVWDGCVLLNQEGNDPLPNQFIPNKFMIDRTAFEADYNHIHLNDFFCESFSPYQLFELATKIIEVWTSVLHKQFSPSKRFILILSFDEEDVVLRFYSIRENESAWIDVSSLESYLEGLLIIEV